MKLTKFLNLTFICLLIFSLLFGASYQAQAHTASTTSSTRLVGPNMPVSPTDESKVPHYFGPYPNWANSPFTLQDVAVTINGDGQGATATASVGANGALTSITITNPGSGYTSATVLITGGGSGASADAVVTSSGLVTQILVNDPGSGYTSPLVTISGGGATSDATATAYGSVDSLTLGNPGSGFTFPTVDFDMPDDPNGTIAKAHVTWDSTTGAITGIFLDDPGSGYASAPNVVIRDGTAFDPILTNAARAAQARSQTMQSQTGGRFTPNQAIAPNAGLGASATATINIQNITLDTFGAGYTSTPTVLISDQVGTGSGALATAVADVGGVTAINITNPGSGYVTSGGIKKFVDPLPGLCDPATGGCPVSGKYIPLAVADTASYANSDTYEIGLVQYRTSFSSSLPPTLVRGYVQLETAANAAISQHYPLFNELLDGTQTPIFQSDGVTQWFAVTPPQFLGPVIAATKDKAVRIVFHNLLPTGSDGDLFLPTDSTLMGSGMGPMDMMGPVDQGSVMDGIRNPLCSEYPKSDMCFKDNRATLHLHGGITPWISDGTPHQWITPANEMTSWPEGVSVENVPDMNVCNQADDGCQTFYYTNQQSARLMFYHDHAWGITRLNVYAGEAAGYLISDPTEQKLINNGTIPADQIPLIIQDRTFVPQPSQLAAQDPTWDTARWGGYGNFWYHHVYMPAQNPGDPGGMSGYGRWMYGPWFWPPATPPYGPIANPYYNMDPATNFTTPLATPCRLDDPSTWQYQTDPFCEPEMIPGTPNISVGMEQFNDTPIVNGVAYPTITLDPKSYRLRILNAANDRFFNFQWYVGDPSTASTSLNSLGQVIGETEVALNPAELAAAQTDPVVFPTPVQGTATAGPDWIQIGTEGGFLPAPVVVDGQQPTTWITDPTRFDVGNVDLHSLLLAPAERADVIVDFSKFAGKTLILYNDAPAAFPARVPSYDYYTGAPDLSPVGAPTILPGYGPNSRTILQVKIAAAPAAPAFNLSALNKAFSHKADGSGAFESGQHPIIVGQAAYNSAYGTSFVSSNWCNAPGSTSNLCDGFVRVSDTFNFSFNTLKAPTTKMTIKLEPKAIHDEMNSTTFDEFGRMQANLGIEAQPPTPGLQNVTLYPFVNPQTELIDATNLPHADVKVTAISSAADGTQIWRITHNGVDTHPIHWHLYDVQVLNRVTWDNIILPPDPTELGWKDTLRISPLEDTIVALRPIIPALPFELPNSIRPLNPMMPLGSTAMFNNIDPQGNPTAPIVNSLVNFGWEYVYHCHILSHEEMDMMRPVSVALPPIKADGLTYLITGTGNAMRLTLSWNDNSISETSFLVQKSIDGGTTWTDVGSVQSPLDQPNVHQLRSLLDSDVYNPFMDYQYRVLALNTVAYGGEYPSLTVKSTSPVLAIFNPPAAPTNLTAAVQAGPQVRLAWTDNSSNETGFVIERATGAGAFAPIMTVAANTTSYVDATVQVGNTYSYRVMATNNVGNSSYSNTVQVVTATPPAAPTNLVATIQTTPLRVQLVWRDNATNETGFVIERSVNGGPFSVLANVGPRQNTGNVTYNDSAVSGGNSYAYRVAAVNISLLSAYTNTASVSLVLPAAPTNVTATGIRVTVNSDRVVITWVDNANNETGFVIQRSTSPNFTNPVTSNVAANATTFTTPNLPRNTAYYFRIQAVNGIGPSAWVNATPFPVITP